MLKTFAKLSLRMMQMTMCTQFFLRDMLGLKLVAKKRRNGGNVLRRKPENIGKERNQAEALLHNP